MFSGQTSLSKIARAGRGFGFLVKGEYLIALNVFVLESGDFHEEYLRFEEEEKGNVAVLILSIS